jgi:ABC-type glutathione transport system ATPase component
LDTFAESNPLFSVADVRLGDRDNTRLAIDALQIPAGITAILGYSGAGKTSLLNLLSGFEPPDAGKIVRHPVDLQRSGSQTCRLPMFWCPQNGGLWPHLTASQHVSLVRSGTTQSDQRGLHRPTDSGIISQPIDSSDELLEMFDLTDRKDAVPGQLSQGERSRLSVARAVASAAGVLILDEPLAHVDAARKSGYWNVVLQKAATTRTSIVFASHEPEVVLRAAKTVACLEAGRVTFQGPTVKLLQNPPSSATARLLGPVNWFVDPAECSQWFVDGNKGAGNRRAIRPTELKSCCDAASELEVLSTIDCGLYQETKVRHTSLKQIRSIVHRHGTACPNVGSRVSFQIVASPQHRVRGSG